jgi:hypothetical protein
MLASIRTLFRPTTVLSILLGPACLGLLQPTSVAAATAHCRAWRIVSAANSAGPSTQLTAVSADSTNDAWAAGWVGSSAGFVEHWDGRGWNTVAGLPPLGGPPAIAAFTPRNVWAVADSSDGFLHWDGTHWRWVPAAPGGGGRLVALAGSPTDLWAAGDPATLIEHWNGSRWSLVRGPNPAPDGRLSALHVTSAKDVWAVGTLGYAANRSARAMANPAPRILNRASPALLSPVWNLRPLPASRIVASTSYGP